MIEIPERVKDALRDGRMLKNYRFNVLKDDGTLDFAIENENLVSESVKYDERMCSGSQIKFGLCEGSSLEFQYFDKPNINGKQLQTFIDVQYIDEAYTYENVLQFSKYWIETVETAGKYRVYCATQNGFDYVWLGRGGSSTQYTPTVDDNGTYFVIDCEAGDSLEVEWEGHVYDTFLQSMTPIYVENTYTIPMGFFTVAQCPVQFSTGIRKVTAYNKLKSEYLDQKANDFLLDVFGSSALPVSVYDIEKVLLSSYEVDQSGRLPLSWEPSNPYYPMEGTLNIGFESSDSGNDNPFNYYSWAMSGGSLSNTGKIILKSTVYELDDAGFDFGSLHYIGLEFLKGIFEAFERNIYSQFTTILTNAHFKNSVTGETVFQDFASRWYAFCGFGISRRQEGGGGDIFESYSTIQYEYNQAHGITNSCKGTASDFINRIYEYYNGDAFSPAGGGKAYRIVIYLPLSWQLRNSNGQGYIEYYFDGFNSTNTEPLTYKYYDSDTQTAISKEYPHVYYGNGDIFKKINGDSPDYTGPLIDLSTIVPISEISGITEAEKITLQISALPEFTLREIISADYETVCQFGKLDRITDLFSGEELNTGGLYPRDDLYPANDLYPGGKMDKAIKSAYSKLWTDTVGEQTFRNLIIKYKGLDENQQEKEFELQRTVNANGTTDYYITSNWLFKNLVWTAEQIGTYADAMVAKMQGVKWFPFELWGAGLPYLETGDEIEIITADGSYTSYILQRQLSGIQNLQDTYINGELDIF